MAKINKVKEKPVVDESALARQAIEDKILAEAEALDIPKIPNESWLRMMIYDIRFSDAIKDKATFDRVPPSVLSGFTLRFAILGYIPPPPAVQKLIPTLSVKDPANIHVLIEGLNVRTYLVMNEFKLSFANIVKPDTERSAILAYAKFMMNKWNIPILIGIEMLVKFAMKNKSKLTLKDFGLENEQKLPASGLGVVFECFRYNSEYEYTPKGSTEKKKGWNTEFTTYDKKAKTNAEGIVTVVSEAQVDAVYEKMVEMEEQAKEKSKKTKDSDTSFPYGANVKDTLADDENTDAAEAVDSLVDAADTLD